MKTVSKTIITDDTGLIQELDMEKVGTAKLWKDKDAYIIEVCMKDDRKCTQSFEFLFYSEEKARYYLYAIFENLQGGEGRYLDDMKSRGRTYIPHG